MKTAMQELKDYLSNTYGLTSEDIALKIEELLDKEKQQMKDAWEDGGELDEPSTFEQYYSETFKQN